MQIRGVLDRQKQKAVDIIKNDIIISLFTDCVTGPVAQAKTVRESYGPFTTHGGLQASVVDIVLSLGLMQLLAVGQFVLLRAYFTSGEWMTEGMHDTN